jgi:hypothetical protein
MVSAGTATRAKDAIRPAMGDEVGGAGFFMGKGSFPLGNGHLMDTPLGSVLGHAALVDCEGRIA